MTETEAGDYAIKINNLNKSFQTFQAVRNLQFTVAKATCFGLLGPNGAGKTTTLKLLYGKAKPDLTPETQIDVFGLDPHKGALGIKSFAGIVPQQDNLDSELNVRDNLRVYAKFYGLSPQETQKQIDNLLSFMELEEKALAKVKELSGGMQRRLTIARALINHPRLLILDEPTTGLDPQVRHLIWNKLRELKNTGVTILLTTHYMEEAFQICDRIIIMDKGEKILEGSPRDLLRANLEKHVLEIPWLRALSNSTETYLQKHQIRYEFFNDTLFAYSNSYESLASFGENLKLGDYYLRNANLEDLFLKVTGRSLNELQ